jgi:hypothetical protein
MNARTQVQLAVMALGVTALGLGAVLVFRGPSVSDAPAAARACTDHTLPGPLMPSADDTPLLLWTEKGVKLTLDGAAVISEPDAPLSFKPGEHTVRVECAGAPAVEHRFYLESYQAAAVYAECSTPPQALFFGAACRTCGKVADEDALRAQAAKLPKTSGLRVLSEAQQAAQRREAARQRAVLLQRWNLLTDRYFRVLTALGHDATDAVDSAHFRFEELSKGVLEAQQKNDTLSLDASVRAGEATLSALVNSARGTRPNDCDFQERLTRAF